MRKFLFSIVSLFVLISCASVSLNTNEISSLEARIDAYYRAKMDHNYKEAFTYEHLSLDELFTEKLYITNAAKSPIELLDANVLSIDLNESKDMAIVELELTYKLLPLKGFEKFDQVEKQKIQDKWAYKKGNWYHIIQGITKDW